MAICLQPKSSDFRGYPFVTYEYTRTETFQKNNCGGGQIGSFVDFSKTYYSDISFTDAYEQGQSDPNYNSEGQAYANANGTCSATCETRPTIPSFQRTLEYFCGVYYRPVPFRASIYGVCLFNNPPKPNIFAPSGLDLDDFDSTDRVTTALKNDNANTRIKLADKSATGSLYQCFYPYATGDDGIISRLVMPTPCTPSSVSEFDGLYFDSGLMDWVITDDEDIDSLFYITAMNGSQMFGVTQMQVKRRKRGSSSAVSLGMLNTPVAGGTQYWTSDSRTYVRVTANNWVYIVSNTVPEANDRRSRICVWRLTYIEEFGIYNPAGFSLIDNYFTNDRISIDEVTIFNDTLVIFGRSKGWTGLSNIPWIRQYDGNDVVPGMGNYAVGTAWGSSTELYVKGGLTTVSGFTIRRLSVGSSSWETIYIYDP